MPMPYQLKTMYGEGKFEDILELARITEELQGFGEWDYYYYMLAAYKLKDYELCLNIFRKFKQLFPNSKYLMTNVAGPYTILGLKALTKKRTTMSNIRSSCCLL